MRRPVACDVARCLRRRGMGQWYPRQDSNLRTWFRKPLLYPLSYGGAGGVYRDVRAVMLTRATVGPTYLLRE